MKLALATFFTVSVCYGLWAEIWHDAAVSGFRASVRVTAYALTGLVAAALVSLWAWAL